MHTILLLGCATLFGTSVAAQELKWRKYTNERFGFALSYPAMLIAGSEPQNGAGREFHTRDDVFSVSAQAHFLSPETGNTFESNWNEELNKSGVTITYKKKAASWYVVSGVTDEGTEYYHKFFVKDRNWVELAITYPHAQNAKYDKSASSAQSTAPSWRSIRALRVCRFCLPRCRNITASSDR